MSTLSTIGGLAWSSVATVGGLAKASVSSVGGLTTGITYIVSEGAEGGTTPSGWTDANTPTWNYGTPLEGTYSLSMNAANKNTYYSFTAASEVWCYTLFSTNSLTNGPYVMQLRDSGGTLKGTVRFGSSGQITITNGTTGGSSANGVVTTNTTYSVWMYYKKGTGADGITRAYVSTTTTRPAVTKEVTNGDSTSDVARFRIEQGAGTNVCVWDHMRLSTQEIGSSPT